MASTSSIERQPPSYILQSWHREQIHYDNQDLLGRIFIVAPDGAIPLSKLRQRFRMIYEERTKPRIVINRDPWDLPNANPIRQISIKELVNSETAC